MTSMTGFAYAEETAGNRTVSVEIKSYNSRFLDLTVNLPSYLSRLEPVFRDKVVSGILRGKIDVYIKIREDEPETAVTVNTEAVRSYQDAIAAVAEVLGRPAAQIPLELVVQQEGVLVSRREYDVDEYLRLIEPVFDRVFTAFVADRQREGQNLQQDLLQGLSSLENAADFFAGWQPKMESAFKENIIRRFYELLGEAVDEQRVFTEVAALLVKYTINEEITRLKSHLAALRDEIENQPVPGKKIDFICQEINREINTIGSKNQFAGVGAMVISAKNALENIREQARNVE